jgi:hypothetical protein
MARRRRDTTRVVHALSTALLAPRRYDVIHTRVGNELAKVLMHVSGNGENNFRRRPVLSHHPAFSH